AGVPVVAAGTPRGLEGTLPFVSGDDYVGAVEAMTHLVDTGRTRIAHISGPLATYGGFERDRAYREVLGDRVDEQLVVAGDYSFESGAAGARTLLDRQVRFDAIFAGNDPMAAGALEVI